MKTTLTTLALAALLGSVPALAHQGHKHPKTGTPPAEPAPALLPAGAAATSTAPTAPTAEQLRADALARVAAAYRERVQPIVDAKCADCHTDRTRYPWYHAVPGVRQLIDHDVAEAREHLDFGAGFPFKSHATPEEDLEAIRHSAADGTMPPPSYAIMHRDARLTGADAAAIAAWAEEGLALLNRR